MQVVPVDTVKPGMILAKPICRKNDGVVLLQENIELKPNYINKIKMLNYDFVWIHDYEISETETAELLEPIKTETRQKAITMMRLTFNQFRQDESLNITKLQSLVKDLLDYILNDQRIVYIISQMRNYDNYTFNHSVDVCVISILVGSVMGLNRNQLEVLGVSAILHDIGKALTDFRILNKPAKLDPEEYEKVKLHTKEGYELLKSRTSLSFVIPHIALQHHEREDGSGYPRGLTNKRIHPYAKIIAIGDVFAAMTSDRVYQRPVHPSLAIQEICNNAPKKFHQATVDCFIKIAAPYVRGNILRLNNNQTVTVTYISRNKCLVKVISDSNESEIFNLYQRPELSVSQLLH